MRRFVESSEQVTLMSCLRQIPYRGLTVKDFVFAIPNGGSRGGRRAMLQAMRKVAEGLTKGVPDIFCPVPVGNNHGLFIELKKPKEDGGKPSDVKKEQREWITRLRDLGYRVEVAFGWIQARDFLLDHLGVTGHRNNMVTQS
jgi:hypothetical protein